MRTTTLFAAVFTSSRAGTPSVHDTWLLPIITALELLPGSPAQ